MTSKAAILLSVALCSFSTSAALCQDSTPAATAKTPLDHVLGTITDVDPSSHTVTLKEDKTDAVVVIKLAETKTILKVEPTAKDLKNAVRITSDNLEKGDRIDVRGSKADGAPPTLAARSVILMSARALEESHQQQAAAWANSTSGTVTAVDPAAATISINSRAAGATQSIAIKTVSRTDFTRYSAEGAKAMPSQFAQIEVGDQVKVVGDKSEDGTSINAQRVYSGAFRTISATISALGSDGKSLTVKDLASKKEVSIALTEDASIHKLPPMMAGFLARRLNPNAAAPAAGGQPMPSGNGGAAGGAPPAGFPAGSPDGGVRLPGAPGAADSGPGGPGADRGKGRGDISQMIEHLPKIALADLKAGDALVISGVAKGTDNSSLLANTLIAGVEPILQAAPQQRGGRSVGGDWGLGEMSAPQ